MRETPKLPRGKLKELFHRIGGDEGLEKILLEFYERMAKDILIGFFFEGKNLPRIAEQQKNFLMKAWGIKEHYAGLSPAQAHIHLPPILSGHFDRRFSILKELLEELHIEEEWGDLWIRFEKTFVSSIAKRGGRTR